MTTTIKCNLWREVSGILVGVIPKEGLAVTTWHSNTLFMTMTKISRNALARLIWNFLIITCHSKLLSLSANTVSDWQSLPGGNGSNTMKNNNIKNYASWLYHFVTVWQRFCEMYANVFFKTFNPSSSIGRGSHADNFWPFFFYLWISMEMVPILS